MLNKKTINRRDFLSGVAIMGAAFGLSPLEAMAKRLIKLDDFPNSPSSYYPPAQTGMRGSHKGSFEVSHAVAWQGKKYPRANKLTDSHYDLIIVGAGISGLATAHYARKKLGEHAKILIIENHDDFGGHAKRNEFTVEGRTLIGHGGSQSIDSPKSYSAESMELLKDLGIDVEKFHQYFDTSYFKKYSLGKGLYIKETQKLFAQQADHVLDFDDEKGKIKLTTMIASLPLSDEDKQIMNHIFVERINWLSGIKHQEKIYLLKTTSLENLLITHAGLSKNAMAIFREDIKTLMGQGWDCWSGMEALRLGHPSIKGLAIDDADIEKPYSDEPFIFHFPDGNASIARLLVKRLIADITGDANKADMDSIVQAKFNYNWLDRASNATRIRLNSTVVNAKNVSGGVEIQYVRAGKSERVMASKVVMACYNHILPFIMPEMETAQINALQSVEKAPLTYLNVAVTNWRAWEKAGIKEFLAPGCVLSKAHLDYPVSMGGYHYSQNPDEPTVILFLHVPVATGLHPHEQARKGRHQMYGMSLDDYEQELRTVMEGAFKPYGFDFDKEVVAITVNRWPHGYTYEYNELFDDPSFGPYHGSAGGADKGPHVLGRQKIGNIAIANSDSSAYAYVQGATDAAHRAVDELYQG